MISKAIQLAREFRSYVRLPAQAKAMVGRDKKGLPLEDPGAQTAIEEGIGWLCRAQDHSRYQDGGVARHYSLIDGWSPSYPETTGYIIPTVLARAEQVGDETLRHRARLMLDWLVSIQLPGGGFQGGLVDSQPVVPVTFNTGQILIGLAAGVAAFGDVYRPAMRQAADWLAQSQDDDGCWRRHPTPFAEPGEKAYETHVAWGLFEAARMDSGRGYGRAAMTNVRWALGLQEKNGWFNKCCLSDPTRPLTHTLGYVLRGILEAYRFDNQESILESGMRTADGLLSAIRLEDGFIPGRLYPDWTGAVPWVCLTGSVQIAHCWLMLYRITGDKKYLDAALAANRFVRRSVDVHGTEGTRGGVKGSFPVNGQYGKFEYLNWACKFFVDANMLELELT